MADMNDTKDPIDTQSLSKPTRQAVAITSQTINVASVSSFVADDAAGAVSSFVGTTRNTFQGKRTLRLEYEAYEPMAIRAMEVKRKGVWGAFFLLAKIWLDRSGKKNSTSSCLARSLSTPKQKICDAASTRWELTAIAITHRIGTVEVGEASVIMAASSAHRRDALEVRGERESFLFPSKKVGFCFFSRSLSFSFFLTNDKKHPHQTKPIQAVAWAIDELKATVPIWKKEFFVGGGVWKENEEGRRLIEAARRRK